MKDYVEKLKADAELKEVEIVPERNSEKVPDKNKIVPFRDKESADSEKGNLF